VRHQGAQRRKRHLLLPGTRSRIGVARQQRLDPGGKLLRPTPAGESCQRAGGEGSGYLVHIGIVQKRQQPRDGAASLLG